MLSGFRASTQSGSFWSKRAFFTESVHADEVKERTADEVSHAAVLSYLFLL